MAGRRRRGTSFGTVFMILLTVAVLGSSAFVLMRLSRGHTVDLSGLQAQVVSLGTDGPAGMKPPDAEAPATPETRAPAATQQATAAPSAPLEKRRTVLTFGGTVAVEDQVRRSGYAADTKKYDFSDSFMLIRPEIQGSVSGVFFENLLMDDTKVSATVIPAVGAAALKAAGFSCAFAGFSRAWEKNETGIQSTIRILRDSGITPLGLAETEQDTVYAVRDADGIRVALMQYTATVSANTRKAMQKRNGNHMIPEADPAEIAKDIADARNAGAEIVVVLLNWGKVGSRNPDKAQLALAQEIAESGADLIIGAGSRVPQRVEPLLTADGRQVLCAYSLGTLISDSRKNSQRMSSYLLHVELTAEPDQKPEITGVTYTPTYVWKYRQDSKDYYRVVPSDRSAPDGMDSDQIRQMQKALTTVRETLESGPASIR